jgi:hypothetical protein
MEQVTGSFLLGRSVHYQLLCGEGMDQITIGSLHWRGVGVRKLWSHIYFPMEKGYNMEVNIEERRECLLNSYLDKKKWNS